MRNKTISMLNAAENLNYNSKKGQFSIRFDCGTVEHDFGSDVVPESYQIHVFLKLCNRLPAGTQSRQNTLI